MGLFGVLSYDLNALPNKLYSCSKRLILQIKAIKKLIEKKGTLDIIEFREKIFELRKKPPAKRPGAFDIYGRFCSALAGSA